MSVNFVEFGKRRKKLMYLSLPLYIRSIIRSIVKVLFIQPFSLHFYIHIAYVYSHHSKNRKCNQIYFKRNSKDSKLHIVFVNSYYLFIIDGEKDHQKEGRFYFHHWWSFQMIFFIILQSLNLSEILSRSSGAN